ncbi:MAG: DUF1957 domain-containing protein [Candidatus Nitrohelix vancouverensis]|uniref:DUF1957 domain-containing protein n=1 Tax=Candidatus Nitrohelix vancouverensis TaxID=2705534 RepID=A0A7T0BZS4_9BACT|nr:MAG: DUF1957 domain-containing protein [Candidatus Nitrohelix vancouverensis]
MTRGYLAIVLHAHLPFVRRPEHEEFLEEDWFFEALTETYIPLIQFMEGWVRDGVPHAITLSISPPLLAMLDDPLLQGRYRRYLDRAIELSCKELDRTRDQTEFFRVASMYHSRLEHARELFADTRSYRLIDAFRQLKDAGGVELITCAGAHGFLPFMTSTPSSIRAQVQSATRLFEDLFGSPPPGMWLPECAYVPGIENFLKEAGIRYFILESHGVLNAVPRPAHGAFAPIYCPNGVAAFPRDAESSRQVWSSKEGYPGDYFYREFYRDIGFDLDYDYIKPYLSATGDRKMTGFKYHRITGPGDHKEAYQPEIARQRAADHAGNFMFNRERQVEYLAEQMGRPPIITAPYDAELFGHWWFEGPQWLDFLVRKTAYDQQSYQLISPAKYLDAFPKQQSAQAAASSWGADGNFAYWINETNDWIYPHLHKAAERMTQLARSYPQAEGLQGRALNQAARELILAQSSDWPFIMTAKTSVQFAEAQIKIHLNRFTRLYHQIIDNALEDAWIKELESVDTLFPHIDYRLYQ